MSERTRCEQVSSPIFFFSVSVSLKVDSQLTNDEPAKTLEIPSPPRRGRQSLSFSFDPRYISSIAIQ